MLLFFPWLIPSVWRRLFLWFSGAQVMLGFVDLGLCSCYFSPEVVELVFMLCCLFSFNMCHILPVCVSSYLSVSHFICLCFNVPLCVSTYLFVSHFTCLCSILPVCVLFSCLCLIYLSVSHFVCLFLVLPMYITFYLSMSHFTFLCLILSVCVSSYLYVCVLLYLSVSHFTCLCLIYLYVSHFICLCLTLLVYVSFYLPVSFPLFFMLSWSAFYHCACHIKQSGNSVDMFFSSLG